MTRDSNPDASVDRFFDSGGRWVEAAAPRHWDDPGTATEGGEFQEILQSCLAELPPRTAEVFYLREVLSESVEHICRSLDITASDCSESLLCARMRLRAKLEAKVLEGARAG